MKDERSDKARWEVRWVNWVICAMTMHTLYGPWIHDQDHQLSFCDHHMVLKVYRLEWVSGHYMVHKVYRPKENGSVGTESTGTKRTWLVYGVDQWVWRTHNDCLSGSGVDSHENRPLVIIRATMKKLMGLRPNTHFHYVALLSVLDACLQNLIWNIILL
jgi:hypothetical protein